MRLAYITTVLVPGGGAQSVQIEAMVRSFDQALKEKNESGSFLFVSSHHDGNKNLTTSYSWKRVPVPRGGRALRYIPFLLRAFRIVRAEKISHIYTRDVGVALVGRLCGIPSVYEIHKPFETRGGHGAFRFFVGLGGQCVAISEALRSFVLETYTLNADRVISVYDGVFLEPYLRVDRGQARHALRRELGVEEDKMIALYSSHLYKGKGFELIVELAREFSDVLFVIMGRKHEEMDKENLPENFRYIGARPHEEVPRYLMAADILLLPFTHELKTWKYHSSLKMFEYMASGVPVVGSGIGSVSEIFTERNAFLFDPKNKKEMLQVFLSARTNEDERKKRAEEARRDVVNYTWEKRAETILTFLKKHV